MKKGLFILLSLLCILEIDAQDTTIIKQPNIQTNAANLLPPGNCTVTGATSVTGGQSYAYSLACVLSGDVTWRVNGGVLTSYSNTTANVKWTGGFIEVSNPLEGIGGGLALSGPNNSIETPTWLNILSDITTGQLEAIFNGIVVASIEVSIRTVVLKGGTIPPSLSHIAYNGNPGVLTYSGATGGSTSYSYQWQVSSDGYTWSNLTGVTGLTYSPGTLQNNAFYRVLVLQNSVSWIQ